MSHLTEAQPQALSHSSVSHSSKKQSRCQRVYGWVCDRLFGNTDKTVTESAEEQQTRVRRVYNWAYNRLFGTKDKTVIKPSKTTDARNLRDVPNAFKKQTRYRKNIRHILKKKPDELPTHLALYNGWKRSYNIAQNGLSLGLAVVMWPTGVTGIELDMPPHLHPFTYPECPPEYSARQAIAIACLCRVYGLPR